MVEQVVILAKQTQQDSLKRGRCTPQTSQELDRGTIRLNVPIQNVQHYYYWQGYCVPARGVRKVPGDRDRLRLEGRDMAG